MKYLKIGRKVGELFSILWAQAMALINLIGVEVTPRLPLYFYANQI
jgi:hypothetical protein